MGASDRAARGGSASGAWWALLDAQARRVRVVGIAVPLATAALVAIAGSCWALAAGPASAALAMLGIMPLYAAAAGMCAAAVFTGDALVELHASTPMEFRTVQTMRAAVLLVAAAVGGFALFACCISQVRSTATPAGSARFRRRAGQLSWCWSRMRRRFPGRRVRRRSS